MKEARKLLKQLKNVFYIEKNKQHKENSGRTISYYLSKLKTHSVLWPSIPSFGNIIESGKQIYTAMYLECYLSCRKGKIGIILLFAKRNWQDIHKIIKSIFGIMQKRWGADTGVSVYKDREEWDFFLTFIYFYTVLIFGSSSHCITCF